jgi:DNA processing protein
MGEHLTVEEPAPVLPRDRVTLREQQVLDAVPVGCGAPVDSIALAAGMSVLAVQGALKVLQERRLVIRADDGWQLTPAALGAPGEQAP